MMLVLKTNKLGIKERVLLLLREISSGKTILSLFSFLSSPSDLIASRIISVAFKCHLFASFSKRSLSFGSRCMYIDYLELMYNHPKIYF